MTRDSHASLHDLALFVEMAGYFEYSPHKSFRAIAKQIKRKGASDTALKDCIARLEKVYGERLVAFAEKASGDNELTESGRSLVRHIQEFKEWRPSVIPKLTIAVSQSLLTSSLFTPGLIWFSKDHQNDIDLRIRLRTEMKFETILQELRYGDDVDLAIVWGIHQRMEASGRGVTSDLFGPEFDLVFVCPTKETLERLGVKTTRSKLLRASQTQDHNTRKALESSLNADTLSRSRVATMKQINQALYDSLPLPDLANGGSRTELDTIDAIVGCIRGRICDYGLVPAVYPELDRFRSQGELCYSEPVGTIQLAWFAKSPGLSYLHPLATKLVEALKAYLEPRYRKSVSQSRPSASFFPHEAKFYEDMKFAYYIDSDREGQEPPQWKWEQVVLQSTTQKRESSIGQSLHFQGKIRNSLNAEFKCEAELFTNLFVLKAKQISSKKDDSVDRFISVFSWCSQKDGIMFGTWSGTDVPPNSSPAVYATIFSHDRLEFDEVHKLASQQVPLRSFLNVHDSLAFDEQPQHHTLTLEK